MANNTGAHHALSNASSVGLTGLAGRTSNAAGVVFLGGFEQVSHAVGVSRLAWSAVAWCVFWTVLFYGLTWTHRWWSKGLAPSTKTHEDEPHYCARNVIGVFHAIIVGVPSLISLCWFMNAPDAVKFASSENFATCGVDPDSWLQPWNTPAEMTALAGLAFTSFTFTDLVLGTLHGLNTIDFVVHHIAFFVAGTLIRSNCMLPFNASALMAMEVSTPFLNYMLYFRHRGDAYRFRVTVNGFLFFVLYLLFRIGLNIFATLTLWTTALKGQATPARVPVWQVWFLLVAITAGAIVQLFWMPMIWQAFGQRIRSLFRPVSEKAPEQPLLDEKM